MTERQSQTEHDPPAGLPPAPDDNPLWEDTPHRQGDPPLRRLSPELAPNTPGGRAARELGHQLRSWRQGRGLTQRQVAARLGWEQPAVARLEGGAVAPTTTTLALLAERLGIRITFGGPAARGEAGAVRVADAAPESVLGS
jgi:ribosome-binding protein aMBF1 (putative translation factor)